MNNRMKRIVQGFSILTVGMLVVVQLPGCRQTQNSTSSSVNEVNSSEQFSIAAMPSSLTSFSPVFSKYVSVFGVHIIATSGVSDQKVLHAATVMAEYLDNDEDGVVDDQNVVNKIVEQKAVLYMYKQDSEPNTDSISDWDSFNVQDLLDFETRPSGASSPTEFDATLEEVLHLITQRGWALAYPSIFGETAGTTIATNMAAARGGDFQTIPSSYPSSAWYTYSDSSCNYACQITEYFYWSLTSVLGAQDYTGRAEAITDEWKANTTALMQSEDPNMYALLTNGTYKLPTKIPNGVYG